MQWSAGGDGLFVTYQQKGPDVDRMQIGFVALSDGQVRPISRDTNTYSTLTLSADGKTLATVQQKAVSNFFILPGAGSTSPTPTPLSVDGEKIGSFNWTADGALLTSDYARLVRTDIYGKNPTVLASDPAAGIIGLRAMRRAVHRLSLGLPRRHQFDWHLARQRGRLPSHTVDGWE